MKEERADMAPRYSHGEVEERLYSWWEERGLFHPKGKGRPFCIVIPPPNITGSLHMGHALNNSIQDCLARWKRMEGRDVLWMPGVDHAGIATQNVVDRELRAEGKSRASLGREEFVRRVWAWKEKYGEDIVRQLRLLGSSCDWTRLRFTMDERYSKAVVEEFVRLYEEGHIYRGDRLINWCVKCRTALSDIEVEYQESDGRLYFIRYPGWDGGFLTVATTRPETMLGDAAVAVHPEDERYLCLAGKEVDLPLTGRKIPVVADARVEREFGTGAVKVTPAHDALDFEIGSTHGLPFLRVIGEDGRMTPEAGKFRGMDREECRRKVVEELKKQDLLEKEEAHSHSLGRCYRCGEVIEPLVSLQWFVSMDKLPAPAAEAVREGSVRFIPGRWKGVYLNWMDNIRDWCISRQIWWGHRIPAWHCGDCGFINVSRTTPSDCGGCGSGELEQDRDVLDTWFSSALWPFAGLGWPDDTEDLRRFYPTSTLVTGHEIIYFWVARMLMTGYKFMGGKPFSDVYIHGIVRDAEGRKMSKSMGNVVDPREVIASYGTDALRLAILSSLGGQDIKFGDDRLGSMRNFVNKLWNAGRFIVMNLEGGVPPSPDGYALDDRWILAEAEALAGRVGESLENYRFQDACQEIYDFTWHSFCDWYLELAKPRLSGGADSGTVLWVLLKVWPDLLKLLHPFAPFVTEELWRHLPDEVRTHESIMEAKWPAESGEFRDEEARRMQELKFSIIRAGRMLRIEQELEPSARAVFEIAAPAEGERKMLEESLAGIKTILNASEITLRDTIPGGAAAAVTDSGTAVSVKLGEGDSRRRMEKLKRELLRAEKEILACRGKLSNEQFLKKAPREIIEKERRKEEELLLRKEKIERHLGTFS